MAAAAAVVVVEVVVMEVVEEENEEQRAAVDPLQDLQLVLRTNGPRRCSGRGNGAGEGGVNPRRRGGGMEAPTPDHEWPVRPLSFLHSSVFS